MKSTVFLRTAYNYDMNAAGDESGLACSEPSLTKQQFAEEVDINTIVRRFNLTGQLPQNVAVPTYQDFDGVFDFHSAMNVIAQAHEGFDLMPAEVRSRFHNDPGEFLAFVNDEKNTDEAIRLGLAIKRVEPSLSVSATPVATPPAAAAKEPVLQSGATPGVAIPPGGAGV